MRFSRVRAVGAALVVLAIVAGACGKSGDSSSDKTTTTVAKPAITIGSEKFSESIIVAEIYAKALEAKGYTVNRKYRLGTREIYEPALERGEIDLVPDYAATLLEFINKNAGEASPDATATVAKLRERLQGRNVTALDPSTALDANAFGVTVETAQKYSLKKLSDVAPYAAQWTLGAPPECPTRPFCGAGLKAKYGLTFKGFKALDFDGPLTKGALKSGDVQIGLLSTTDADPAFVLLEDDKKLQNADVLTPIIRTDKATDEVKSILNAVSAKLTTPDLAKLDKRADVDKEDPEAVGAGWAKDNGFSK